ncbi:MAG: rubrerythrin family protein [Candidatus Helarchaeota archaeon]|nr:rubrerythrin family protein [Candidatus Helarchaeota archaeon]
MGIEEDLKTAFAGESQANRKYLAFAKKAEKDGFPNIAQMFRVIAEAETVHALNHLRVMKQIKTTKENIKAAKAGEHYEIAEMYPPMKERAENAGNKAAANTFHYALETEKAHHSLYDAAIEAVSAGKDIAKKKYWICPVCGFTGEGDPPENCPVCKTKKERFKIFE